MEIVDIVDGLRGFRVETDTASWHPTICEKAVETINKLLEEADYLKDMLKDAQSRAEKAEEENKELHGTVYKLMEVGRKSAESLSVVQIRSEKAEKERDAAVRNLRQMCVGGNTCAFCKHGRNCGKEGPGRKTVEPCWEWCGPDKEE